ncbi:peptidylprolyl isomerase [Tropicimonas sp. IMCC34043]|uniref:peptidylprolyl isomerase n=1 Tax=Tropicimonas sp. IMCC34043 TaxID=2248760 RepID=UPI0018E4FA8F|nr:peptidylprolyl isomerase [Tropicimonas sp. IMCC34043]
MRQSLGTVVLLVLGAVLNVAPALAQQGSPFVPVVIVNDRPITEYELEQRILMLQLFRTPGDLKKQAMDGLIDDRLRRQAAESMSIEMTEEQLTEGMTEFASRVNMDLPTFLDTLSANGVAPESYRDFVQAGIVWREVVGTKFAARTQVGDTEIDRALALSSRKGGAEALLAEIILPARDEQETASSNEILQQIQDNVKTRAEFAAAAREYSAAPSAPRGGRLEKFLPLSDLPAPVRSQILTMAPGQMTEPLPGNGFIAIFQLLELRETGTVESGNVALEYAIYLIPGGRSQAALSEAAKVRARVDTCSDLYGVAKGQPPERLVIETRPLDKIPASTAMELAKLDPGESSTALVSGQNLEFLMLCARTPIFDEELDRAVVRNNLRNQRIAAYGDGYLAQLKADATIRYP